MSFWCCLFVVVETQLRGVRRTNDLSRGSNKGLALRQPLTHGGHGLSALPVNLDLTAFFGETL